MRGSQAEYRDALKQRVECKRLQERGCDVMSAVLAIDDKLRDPSSDA